MIRSAPARNDMGGLTFDELDVSMCDLNASVYVASS